MDPRTWATTEEAFAFRKMDSIRDSIISSNPSDTRTHIGMIYLAIGRNHGKSISRFVIFIPFFNPSTHGYNFAHSHPYIYAKGFIGVASSGFYDNLEELWIAHLNQAGRFSSDLLECAPIMICEVDDTFTGQANLIPWLESTKDENSMAISLCGGSINFWIHGPDNLKGLTKKVLLDMADDSKLNEDFNNFIDKWSKSSGKSERDGVVLGCFKWFEERMTSCNSFSYPTFHAEFESPVKSSLMPNLANVRMKIGGVFDQSDRTANEVHIPVGKLDSSIRLLKLAAIWSIFYNKNVVVQPKSIQQQAKAFGKRLEALL
ncbi:hypothetical protein MP638_007498 [Amoeboaphelidium occidentale]|nr:hypothetical protein MP638_007498 [Amoeboaphelidium occidentale]